MQLTGAEIVIECLKEQGVDTVFGYPGGTILNVYDALYKHADEINHILTSHEQGAAHAADGYARATGKVGVCMATSGPGATNLVTGIATAYMDSIPIVAITANVNLPALGKDSFQEVDIAGVTMPITKHGYIVKDINVLADTIRKAFQIAQSGRPGPVLVDITKDVTANTCEYTYQPAVKPVYENKYTEEQLDEVVKLMEQAEKPYMYIGGGVILSGASEQVRELAKKLDCPVCDTLMGKGAFDGYDDMYTGMIGMHGTKVSNLGVSRADLVIVVGARFSDRVIGNASKFAPNAKIIHIDIDAAEIDKNIPTNASIVGDAKEVLKLLNSKLAAQSNKTWMSEIEDLKKQNPDVYSFDTLNGPAAIKKIYELTEGDAIITTDVGQHQMWAAQNYTFKEPRTFLSSGGLGTMGYGVGAAIGAKYGRPDKTVINIAGDGCFRMNLNEIATAARYNVPIIQVVLNNHVLGMVRQWQTLFYDHRYSNTVLDDSVDFVKVAEGLGAMGIRANTLDEFEAAMKTALTAGRPVVIDVTIAGDDKVWPMVAPGAAIDTCFSEDDM